ncbi:metal-dependent transcriptional regulator [Enterococcus sp. LJL98]
MTPNREDYLKLILELGGDDKQISNKEIVIGLNISAASVSEMISKLVKEGFIDHVPYQGVQLTPKGLSLASSLIRKHRLWEVFLVEHLGYSWNDVHDEAEVLEHITSSTLANRLERYLDSPKRCPHGGMIPEENQLVHEQKREALRSYPIHSKIRIARVVDERELLDYLVMIDLHLQEEYEIIDVSPYEGPITLANQEKTIVVSYKAANSIFVDLL